eukprot:scaffold10.g2307.t1
MPAGPRPAQRLLRARQQHQPRPHRRQGRVVAQSWRSNGNPEIPDRVVASLPYLLPMFDGLRYGKFALMQFPQLGAVFVPLEPLARLYFSVPFAGLVSFFIVYLGVVNNTRWSRFVRYNAMQAILLDVLLIVPGVVESVLRPSGLGGFGLTLYIQLYNAIFLFLLVCFAYGIASCMLGKSARLPIVGDAADMQVR